jgi:hypothetical protein
MMHRDSAVHLAPRICDARRVTAIPKLVNGQVCLKSSLFRVVRFVVQSPDIFCATFGNAPFRLHVRHFVRMPAGISSAKPVMNFRGFKKLQVIRAWYPGNKLL